MRLKQACKILFYTKDVVLALARKGLLKSKKMNGRTIFNDESVLWQRFSDMKFAGQIQRFPYSPERPCAIYLWPTDDGVSIRRQMAKAKRQVDDLRGVLKKVTQEFVDSRGSDEVKYPSLPELFEAVVTGGVDILYVKDVKGRIDRKFLEWVFERAFGVSIEYLNDD